MAEVTCPSCSGLIRHVDRLKVGQKVRCQTCDENLIVLQISPVKLAWASANHWFTDDMSANKTTTRKKTRAAVSYGAYEDVDWDDDDRDWRSTGGRSRSKKRNRRFDRRRREESSWDF